jgi:ADP-ribosyl-[dinitrogen reductase] hydrolase
VQLTQGQLDRACGVLLATAAGDALGAAYGASAVPENWRQALHGWPGLRSQDLVNLAVAIAGGT